MNFDSIGYKINSNLGEDYLEISLQVKTDFNKEDLPYIKLYLNETLENTNAYCKSKNAHRILLIHNYVRRAYSLFMPTFVFSGYRFYKSVIRGRIQASNGFQNKAKIWSIALLKTTCVFIPIFFAFSALLEYSNRLPLMFLQESLIKFNDKKLTFQNYLKFKEKLHMKIYNSNRKNKNDSVKH